MKVLYYYILLNLQLNRSQKHSNLFNSEGTMKKGILIACNQNREDRAVSEAIDIFTQVPK
jgi:hypothetical protein